ncbi:MAG: nucleotidyltransferase domain-containing protein [Candidatus Woesearchaeota archaeon]
MQRKNSKKVSIKKGNTNDDKNNYTNKKSTNKKRILSPRTSQQNNNNFKKQNKKKYDEKKYNNKKYNEILKSVLEENKPNKKILEIADFVIKQISNNLDHKKIRADVVLGGSVAKNVFLKNDFDCDVFVRFNYSDFKKKEKELSNILEMVLSDFKPKRVHGSRDYFQFAFDRVNFEVIPVLKIKSLKQALNIMDYSPLHVDWFNKRANNEIRDCVRLLKLFCKAQNIYGAESFINGFSGHVIDIISVYYDSFINVLKTAANYWMEKFNNDEKIIIDVNNHHKGKALFVLNKSKIQGPLVVIDPIDPLRNAAASLSYENFNIFLKASSAFLEKPSKDFFIAKVFDESKILERALRNKKYLLMIKASPLKKSIDVAGCKLLKAYDFISAELKRNDFVIEEKGFYWNKNIEEPGVFYFIVKNPILSKEKIIKGPNLKFKQAGVDFKKKHKKTFEKKGFVFAVENRRIRSINDFISNVINSDFLKDKVLKFNCFEFSNK